VGQNKRTSNELALFIFISLVNCVLFHHIYCLNPFRNMYLYHNC